MTAPLPWYKRLANAILEVAHIKLVAPRPQPINWEEAAVHFERENRRVSQFIADRFPEARPRIDENSIDFALRVLDEELPLFCHRCNHFVKKGEGWSRKKWEDHQVRHDYNCTAEPEVFAEKHGDTITVTHPYADPADVELTEVREGVYTFKPRWGEGDTK